MAYVGPKITPEVREVIDMLHERGVMCMISTAPSDDKLSTPESRAEAYRMIIRQGVDIIESDRPIEMTPNVLVEFLQKPASEFTKEDIIRYIYEKDIQMVNFMYPAGDGRLKTLNFVINNAAYLDAILTCGERVDGSSLFSFIEAGSSDLYVVPRFRTAF